MPCSFSSAVAVALSCTTIASCASLSDLTAGRRDAGSCEAASGCGEPKDSAADSADAAVEEAGDAPAEETAPPFCQGHAFCDDFDTGALGAKWSGIKQSGGMLSLDGAESVSAPQSLRVDVAAAPGVVGNGIELTKQGLGPSTYAHAQAALNVDLEGMPTAQVNTVGILIDPPPTGFSFYVVLLGFFSGVPTLQEYAYPSAGGPAKDTRTQVAFPTGGWHTVDLILDLTTSPLTIHFLVDGAPELVMSGVPSPPASTFTLSIGAGYTSGVSSAWILHFDNAAFDLVPVPSP